MAERKLIIQPITREPKTGKWSTDFPEVARFVLNHVILRGEFYGYDLDDEEDLSMMVEQFTAMFFERYLQNGWAKKAVHIEEMLQESQCNPDDLLYALECRKLEFSNLWHVAVCAKDFVDGLEYEDDITLDFAEEVCKFRDNVLSEVEVHDEQVSFTLTITKQTKVDGKVKKGTVYSSSSKALLEIIGKALCDVKQDVEDGYICGMYFPDYAPPLRPLDQSNKNFIFQSLLEGYINDYPVFEYIHKNLEANKRRKVQADATSIMARMAYLVGFTDDVVYWKEGGKAWDRARKIKGSQKKMPEYMRNSAYDMP